MRWSLGRGVGSGRCAACWSGLYRVSLSLFERRGTALPPSTPPHGPGPAAPLGLTRPSSLTAGVGEVWAPAPLPPAGSVPDGPQCAPEDSLHSHLLGEPAAHTSVFPGGTPPSSEQFRDAWYVHSVPHPLPLSRSRTLSPQLATIPHSPPRREGKKPRMCFCSGTCPLWTAQVSRSMRHAAFCVRLRTVFELHGRRSVCQGFVSACGGTRPLRGQSCLFVHPPVDGPLDCVPPAAMHVCPWACCGPAWIPLGRPLALPGPHPGVPSIRWREDSLCSPCPRARPWKLTLHRNVMHGEIC